MKNQNTARKNTFFGTFAYWKTMIFVFLVSALCITLARYVIPSTIRYALINNNITQLENTADQNGQTDYINEKIESKKAERKEIAANDQVFKWCLDSMNTSFGSCVRDVVVIVIAVLGILGIAGIIVDAWCLVRDTYNWMRWRKQRED